jgi:hypothetical protein
LFGEESQAFLLEKYYPSILSFSLAFCNQNEHLCAAGILQMAD